jgi:hypothetical protein
MPRIMLAKGRTGLLDRRSQSHKFYIGLSGQFIKAIKPPISQKIRVKVIEMNEMD